MGIKKLLLLTISISLTTQTSYINHSMAAEKMISSPSICVDTIKSVKTNYKEEVKSTILDDTHTATWYDLTGRKTASGERFHRDSLTAAYNFSNLGSYLKVTNIKTDISVVVKVTDRMGYKGRNHIDLSKGAFDSIGNLSSGRIRVSIEILK